MRCEGCKERRCADTKRFRRGGVAEKIKENAPPGLPLNPDGPAHRTIHGLIGQLRYLCKSLSGKILLMVVQKFIAADRLNPVS